MRTTLVWLFTVVLTPCLAFAQASITGSVKDASGAILPGVTVEAASPALIEKVRTVTTDGTGQYSIVDLRPGVYSVTFTLAGFSTVKREGIELAGSFAATLNTEMRVGALEETITVTGASPTVDVTSSTVQKVMTVDVVSQIPVTRTLTSVAALVPATTGVNTRTGLSIHGSRSTDQKMVQDGLSIGIPTLTGGSEAATGLNLSAVQEVAVDVAAVAADTGQGGVRVNLIPREGGNVFRGSMFVQLQTEAMQGSNYSDALKAAGLASAAGTKRVWDVNPGYGGPILRDRLWFYATMRYEGSETYVPGMFSNLNAGKPNVWAYVPDTSQPSLNNPINTNGQVRFTTQVTPKNKAAFAYSQSSNNGGGGISATTAPESRAPTRVPFYRTLAASWSSPLTSRLLIDAAAYQQFFRYGSMVPAGESLSPAMIPVTDQATSLSYRSAPGAANVPGAYTNNALRS
ncbi:MAG: carboxypeptidase-like regulatory domain-containing protein, partial [Vicinamibacterales bacterium]